MNGFIGVVILEELTNCLSYKKVMRQIAHYLHLQRSIRLSQTDYLLTITPSHSATTFSLPKNNFFLHTHYHQVKFSQIPTEQEMQYFQIVAECLLILKEHFPSKVEIEVVTESEHLESMLGEVLERGMVDLKRRYLSHLRTIVSQNQGVTLEQVKDVLEILRREDGHKLITLGLAILKKAPTNLFRHITHLDVKNLERLAQSQEYEKAVNQLISKIEAGREEKEEKMAESRRSTVGAKARYDEPGIIHSYVFQLKESNNMERIGFLFEKIASQVDKLEKPSLSKIDQTIFEAVHRMNDSGKLQNNPETAALLDNFLRYLLGKRDVSSWTTTLGFLEECSSFPKVMDAVIPTLQVFYEEFKEKCDPTILDQLAQVIQKYSRDSNTDTSQPRHKLQENCRTHRHTIKSIHKVTKSCSE